MKMRYKIVNGTSYQVETPDEVIRVLESARQNKTRLRLAYGDKETGKDWQESFDVEGTISRSMGPVKIPILIHNARSMGGGGILTHCIVKIVTSRGKRVLYQHSQYHIIDNGG